jgi:hypothetical protein
MFDVTVTFDNGPEPSVTPGPRGAKLRPLRLVAAGATMNELARRDAISS